MNNQTEQTLNHKTLTIKQIEMILSSKKNDPELYQKYLDQIKRSGIFYNEK